MSSSSSWNLRLRRPNEHPFIGKFSSKVSFDKAILPVHMLLQAEELKEEFDDDEAVKDADYYKSKKRSQKRRKYNKQSKLVLEDSGGGALGANIIGLGRFEGNLVDLSLNESLGSNDKPTENDHEGAFRYALLEVVTGSTADNRPTEVNVIPVHDMFYFRRPALTGDKLLDEIDDDYDEKMRRDKLKMQRYRRIGKALEEWEGKDGSRGGKDGDEDNAGSSSSSSKVFDVPALFGSISKKSKGKGGPGGRKGIEQSSSGLADEDQIRELGDEFNGDYRVQFVDDEEDNVVQEQNYLNAVEEDFTAHRDVADTFGGDDGDDTEDEEEEDETEAPPAGVVVTAPTTSIAGIDQDEFDRSTRIARDLLLQGSKKRPRDSSSSNLSSNSQPQVRPTSPLQNTVVAADAPPSTSKSATGAMVSNDSITNLSAVGSSEKYELSEAGLLAFMNSMGGRVTTATLKEAFKSQLKSEGKRLGKKELAQLKFLEIIKAITKADGEGILVLK